MRTIFYSVIFVGCLLASANVVKAQSLLRVVINMGVLESLEVTPDNIFNYQLVNNESQTQKVTVTGTLVYKQSGLRLSYKYNTTLQPGANHISSDMVLDPHWQFSNSALKDLFLLYKKLPQGTYEYCVSVALDNHNSEQQFEDPIDACVYYTVNDIFLINLVTPEDDAMIYEYNPLLSWVVNYPFASELSYRIRLVQQQKGQSNEQAVTRNNPIYTEKNLLGTGLVYPVTAKPLEPHMPYVWTVDAYYKGLLLGGTEAWKFTIVEDSILKPVPVETSYLDVRREWGAVPLTVVGELKLKYVLNEKRRDVLQLKLYQGKGKEVDLKSNHWDVTYGDNRTILDFKNDSGLKHGKTYDLTVTNTAGLRYVVSFTYMNPDFIEVTPSNK